MELPDTTVAAVCGTIDRAAETMRSRLNRPDLNRAPERPDDPADHRPGPFTVSRSGLPGLKADLAEAPGRKVGMSSMGAIRNPCVLASIERDYETVYVAPS